MKWVNRLAFLVTLLIGVGIVKDFFSKYDLLIFDKNDIDEARKEQVNEKPDSLIDLRGTPTHECVCGSNQFYIRATFYDYEIAQYFLDMQCANCGSLATAPTPIDKETN